MRPHLVCLVLLLGATACEGATPESVSADHSAATKDAPPSISRMAADPSVTGRFAALTLPSATPRGAAAERSALGRLLFFDPRLSLSNTVACNSCHLLDRFGVDGLAVSRGHLGKAGTRNAPTVYNTSGHIAQFWDGRAPSLEDQAKGPIVNPVEMAMSDGEAVTRKLAAIPQYRRRFRRAFPQARNVITFDKVADAIASFERRLVTPGRFDRFLGGEREVLSAAEQRGLVRFVGLGCATCHNGAAVGGGSFQRLGLSRPYPNQRDLGRFGVTHRDEDRMVFRVPGLRNIAETAPYFHDGQVATLDDAVRAMGLYQLGLQLSANDVSDLVVFLRSLTGDLPATAKETPVLPGAT